MEEILKHPCIEIGESMVLPEYRGSAYQNDMSSYEWLEPVSDEQYTEANK